MAVKLFTNFIAILTVISFGATLSPSKGHAKTEAVPINVTGEIIDTFCYLSGVMGGPDAVVGSAHHTCALWCAAGGIPIGVRADDGTIYMVLKIKDEDPLALTDTIMELQSDRVTAKGLHYLRDGINYIVVSEVVSNEGVTNKNHEDFGVVPPFSFPTTKE